MTRLAGAETSPPEAMGRPAAGAWVAQAATAAAFLAAYVVLEWVSFIHEYKGIPITPWNPGLGVVFALMVSAGARYAIVLFAGALLAEVIVLRSALGWPIVIGIAAAIALAYGGAAGAARRWVPFDPNLRRLRDILSIAAVGGAGAIVSAVALALLFTADAALDLPDALAAALPHLLGDAIGIAVGTPLTMRLLQLTPAEARALAHYLPGYLAFTAVVLATLWVILGTEGANGSNLFYLLFLPAMIAAVRHGFDGACVALATIQLALVGVLHSHGYDAAEFTEFQMLMLVLTATALVVGVVVSERRQADLSAQRMEAQLREKGADAAEAARHNLVSGMASAVAHEINQPMTAARALGRAAQQILAQPQPDLARAQANLSRLIDQIDHVGAVVRRMREMLRRGRPHLSRTSVGPLLEEAVLLARAEPADSRIELAVADGLPEVYADRVQIQQVVLNLLRNAIDALKAADAANGSELADPEIHVTARWLDRPPRIEIRVLDNGPGIDPALGERLFEPLATSKQDGLGLGLSISRSIIESHGGSLWLEASRPGLTDFRFTLPVQSETA